LEDYLGCPKWHKHRANTEPGLVFGRVSKIHHFYEVKYRRNTKKSFEAVLERKVACITRSSTALQESALNQFGAVGLVRDLRLVTHDLLLNNSDEEMGR